MNCLPSSRATSAPYLHSLLVVLSLALLTTSCGTGTAPQILPAKTMPAESCLMQAEPLPLLIDPSLPGLVRNHLAVADLYWQLAARHVCLADFERGR